MPATILNHYVLTELSVIACEYPHHPDDAPLARAKRRVLADLGVTHVLDLTEPGELLPWIAEPGWTPTRERFAIRDVGIPSSLAAFTSLIERITGRLHGGETIAVHCWGGVGRTGLVAAALLVRHGWPVQRALTEVNRLWRATPKASLAAHRGRTAPETPEQVEFVQRWHAAVSAGG